MRSVRTAVEGVRANRSAALILLGLALIVGGLWVLAAALFGATVGAGVGIVVGGVAVLVVEGLSEDTP